MATKQPLVNLLAPGARARNLDLNALLAIAGHEGAGGGIGDNGHAFGPFQLNNAGGVLTGKFAGETPEQINQWAWSPAGISFALNRIGQVASGLKGARAVKAIATRFERPANVNAEIQDALARYGNSGAAPRLPVSVGAPAPSPGAPTGNPFGSLLGGLIDSTNRSLGLGSSPTLASLFNGPLTAAWGTPGSGPAQGGKAGQGQKGLPPVKPPVTPGRLKLASLDGVTVDRSIAPELQQVVNRFGVHPTSGYRSASHNAAVGGAENSDHLGGDAVDFGGTPQQLAALYAWAQRQGFPYVEPMAQAKNHVHISFRRAGVSA